MPAAIAAAVLAVAGGLDGHARRRESDAGGHLLRIRAVAAAGVPFSVGDWLGRDLPTAPGAVALLRPSVLLSRGFENLRTGESASLLFVGCSDARDLVGHYPPVCYPAHGQTFVSAAPRSWTCESGPVAGTRYRFRVVGGTPSQQFVVDNFMVLPDGEFGRDMDDVRRVARDPALRRYGAASLQVVTDGAMDEARRDVVLEELVSVLGPLFRAMRTEDTGDAKSTAGVASPAASDARFSAGGDSE
jgi:hypothetical protein